MLTFCPLNQFCAKGQSVGVFIRRRYRFLGLYTLPKHYGVAINVGLLALFWWFVGCTFTLPKYLLPLVLYM